MKSKPVEYLPAALLDLEESAAWYEEQQSGVGERFHEAVRLTIRKIQSHPQLGAPRRRDSRKWRVARFPYSVVYREAANQIIIVAIAHAKRREDYWAARIS
jgi:toxin ParE1/3/4